MFEGRKKPRTPIERKNMAELTKDQATKLLRTGKIRYTGNGVRRGIEDRAVWWFVDRTTQEAHYVLDAGDMDNMYCGTCRKFGVCYADREGDHYRCDNCDRVIVD